MEESDRPNRDIPPYADARRNHYDSVHPDHFKDWFLTFHNSFYEALKPTGSLVINIKDKVVDGVRHRYVWQTIEALADHGWFCIDDYLWRKTNPMPGFWPNRLRDGWEYCFHLAKAKQPYMNQDAVRIPVGEWVNARLAKLGTNDLVRHNSANQSGFGRDLSRWVGKQTVLPANDIGETSDTSCPTCNQSILPANVISAALVGKNKGHPAVFPVDLPAFFIKLFCPPEGLVCDPFGGSGTTGIASVVLGRKCLLIDNNLSYCQIAANRIRKEAMVSQDQVVVSEAKNLHNVTYKTIPENTLEQIRFFDAPARYSTRSIIPTVPCPSKGRGGRRRQEQTKR